MPWRQFESYLDAFKYWVRTESEKGQQENEMDDLDFLKGEEGMKESKKAELERIREKLKGHKERMTKGKKQKERKLVE